jgi:hypothetical protein
MDNNPRPSPDEQAQWDVIDSFGEALAEASTPRQMVEAALDNICPEDRAVNDAVLYGSAEAWFALLGNAERERMTAAGELGEPFRDERRRELAQTFAGLWHGQILRAVWARLTGDLEHDRRLLIDAAIVILGRHTDPQLSRAVLDFHSRRE